MSARNIRLYDSRNLSIFSIFQTENLISPKQQKIKKNLLNKTLFYINHSSHLKALYSMNFSGYSTSEAKRNLMKDLSRAPTSVVPIRSVLNFTDRLKFRVLPLENLKNSILNGKFN